MSEAIDQLRVQLGAAIDSVDFVKKAFDRPAPETPERKAADVAAWQWLPVGAPTAPRLLFTLWLPQEMRSSRRASAHMPRGHVSFAACVCLCLLRKRKGRATRFCVFPPAAECRRARLQPQNR